MELRQREALYGPNHPNLADSLSNLAILYNQSGAYDKAQPLYERALRIYETVHGPDHPDVAHTLTDLAVLHLEQASHQPAASPCTSPPCISVPHKSLMRRAHRLNRHGMIGLEPHYFAAIGEVAGMQRM